MGDMDSVVNDSKTDSGDMDSVVNDSKTDSNEDAAFVKSVFDDKWSGTTSEVITFLCGHNLSKYARLFRDEGIDLDLFLTLTDEDLCDIGMTNEEDRKVLLNGLARLNKNKVDDKSGSSLDLSAEEVNRIMKNSLAHLTVMHAMLAHARHQLRRPGVHNTSLNLEMSSAHLLDVLSNEAIEQARFLRNQMTAILDKKPGAVEKRVQQSRKRKTFRLVTIIVSVAVIGYCVHRRLRH